MLQDPKPDANGMTTVLEHLVCSGNENNDHYYALFIVMEGLHRRSHACNSISLVGMSEGRPSQNPIPRSKRYTRSAISWADKKLVDERVLTFL